MVDPPQCSLLDRFILRSPGFPLDLLDRLRFPASVAAAQRLLAGVPEPAAGEIFLAELHQRRAELRRLFDDPRVQEALWLSNPEMYESHWPSYPRHWRPDHRPANVKRLERRLYAYLQRFCAKNDTTSFFGPLNYGGFGGAGPVACQLGPGRVRRRRAFFAYWAAEQLAARIAADPEISPQLPLRPVPTRPRAQLRDLPVPPAVLDPLAYLAGRLDRLPAGPARDRWRAVLDRLVAGVNRFAATPFPARTAVLAAVEQEVAAVAGPAGRPRRGGDGRMFRDRTLLYEECLGDVRLRLPAADQARIAATVTPAAALCAELARRRAADLQAAAGAVFGQVSPDRVAVPFAQFAAAWRRRFPGWPPTPRVDRLVADLQALAAARCQPAAGQADPVGANLPVAVDLPVAVVGSWCTTPGAAVVMSPDLMLAAPDLPALATGDYRVVLGEVHHGVTLLGWMLAVADDPAGWCRAVAGQLPEPGPEQPANLILGRRMKVAPPELPGVSVAAGGVATVDPQLHLGDLLVGAGPGGPQLRAPGQDRPLRFHPPSYGVPDSYALFAAFSYPLAAAPRVRLGRYTPRLTLGGLVYQRRRWVIDAGELPGGFRGSTFRQLLEYRAFRQRAGLPEQVYVRAPGEPKPIYVDFTNFFALELLAEVGRGGGEVSIEEALPAAGDCWLRRPDGRYGAELRTVCRVGAV